MTTITITDIADLRAGDVATCSYEVHEFTGEVWEGEHGTLLVGGTLVRYVDGLPNIRITLISATREVPDHTLCSVETCDHKRDGRSRLCSAHRLRKRLHGDVMADLPGQGRRPGRKSHPLYFTWKGIKARVLDVSNPNYGGRGISMYGPWVDDSHAFLEWMDANLGPRPDGHSLDRIDNDGNYEPGNLRWATASEQRRNQRESETAGVALRDSGRYQAFCSVDGKRVTIGTYDTIDEAKAARASFVASAAPDLPTKLGSVIANVVLVGGHHYDWAMLVDPTDSLGVPWVVSSAKEYDWAFPDQIISWDACTVEVQS